MIMKSRQAQELDESNRQAIGAWKQFAEGAPNGVCPETTGVVCAFSNVPMPFFNMAFLSSPVANLSELNDRMAAIKELASSCRSSWMFFSCDQWLPEELRAAQDQVFTPHDLHSTMHLTGMVTDLNSLSATAANPPLEYRRVAGRETSFAISDLNCAAYGVPFEIGRESILESMFGAEVFAYVGYLKDQPVSAAGVWIVDDSLYVAMVATHPDHRRKGYADAVMRHSLQEAQKATGITRTVLHATEAGLPVYERMGYRFIARFTLYSLPDE